MINTVTVGTRKLKLLHVMAEDLKEWAAVAFSDNNDLLLNLQSVQEDIIKTPSPQLHNVKGPSNAR
jgi:hypothetical protein